MILGYSAEGDVQESDAFGDGVLTDAAGDTWWLRDFPGRAERNGAEVRELARFVHTMTLVDGQAATVEGRPPELFLPADAASEPIPDAPKATHAAALAGTTDTLWVAGLGPKTDRSYAPWVTTRTGSVWRTDPPPDLAAATPEIVLAATADRVAMLAQTHEGWRLAERGEAGWGVPTAVDVQEVGAAVYGGDGQLWLLAARDLDGVDEIGDYPAGYVGSVVALGPDGCEAALGQLGWPAAMQRTEAGVAVLGLTPAGEAQRFDLSGACTVDTRTLAAAEGSGLAGTTFAVNGEAAFLTAALWVKLHDRDTYPTAEFACY